MVAHQSAVGRREFDLRRARLFPVPRCDRRCKAVYPIDGEPACRQHLGYRSQSRRPGSWGTLERIFDRDLPTPRRYQPTGSELTDMLGGLPRRKAEARVVETIGRISIV